MNTHHDTDLYEAAAAQADSDLAHIKTPAGTTHGQWERNLDRDCWSRSLLWETHGEDERATVDICGTQYDEGTHDVGITVWGVSEGEPLTASQARRLAVHLLQAADTVSRIGSADTNPRPGLLREDFRLRKVPAGWRLAQRVGGGWELLADVYESRADANLFIARVIGDEPPFM